ncbi:replicative DNA helicase [Thermodesulfobacteriota bacterium]
MRTDYKIPPQAIEAEESVLAAMMLVPEKLAEAIDLLDPDAFYRTSHQHIFRACKYLFDKGQPADLVTVTSVLRDKEKLEEVGGASCLSELLDQCPLAHNMEHYARIVKEKALLRKTINTAHQIISSCHSSNGNVRQVVDTAQKNILEINYNGDKGDVTAISDLAIDSMERYETIAKDPGNVTGIPSGFSSLDALTCGFQKSDLIIIASRPSMGKTALQTSMAANMTENSHCVAIFSLEMSKQQIFDRLISGVSRVNLMKFRSGRFAKEDWVEMNRAASKIYDWPMHIEDIGGLSYMDIRRISRALKVKEGIEIVFIDYLGLVEGDKQNGRVGEIESITRNMKAMAKELSIPVVLLSQLNRKCEERANPYKRPVLSDLRDSGAIEQDSDMVLFLYRDERYNKNSRDRGIAELNIAKQRNGPCRMVKLAWLEKIAKFEPRKE